MCLDSFKDPRMLPCGHTFCLECLQKYIQCQTTNDHDTEEQSAESEKVCSLCRKTWNVPKLNDLPKNFVVHGLLTILQNASSSQKCEDKSKQPVQQEPQSISLIQSIKAKSLKKLPVDILSIRRGKLLFGSRQLGTCKVYSTNLNEGKAAAIRSCPPLPRRLIGLHDVTWDDSGGIVCAARCSQHNHVMVLDAFNTATTPNNWNPFFPEIITEFRILSCFVFLSRGRDFYLSDIILFDGNWRAALEPWKSGLEDEALLHMNFMPSHLWLCFNVVRTVSTGDRFDYWTLEVLRCSTMFRLRKHTVEKRRALKARSNKFLIDFSLDCCNAVTLPFKYCDVIKDIDCAINDVELSMHSTLAYDETIGIFLSDYRNDTVHLFSTSGQYVRKLISQADGLRGPCSLAVNVTSGCRHLIIGQQGGEVKVFALGVFPGHFEFVSTENEYNDQPIETSRLTKYFRSWKDFKENMLHVFQNSQECVTANVSYFLRRHGANVLFLFLFAIAFCISLSGNITVAKVGNG